MCVEPWAVKSQHWCANASHKTGEMHGVQLWIEAWLPGVLKCGMGCSGLESAQEWDESEEVIMEVYLHLLTAAVNNISH